MNSHKLKNKKELLLHLWKPQKVARVIHNKSLKTKKFIRTRKKMHSKSTTPIIEILIGLVAILAIGLFIFNKKKK